MYLQGGKGQYKIVVYTQALQDPQGLHLEVAELLDKGTTYGKAMNYLRMDLANWLSQPMIHVSQQTIQVCLRYINKYLTSVVR